MGAARRLAVVVLARVAEQGAFASRALDAELSRGGLSERDAALATEIVYGTLRALPELDRQIATHLTRDASKLDGVLRAALRAGCYQLMHLSRVPPHAIVNDSVELVRAMRGPKLGGVANAVLRKLAHERPEDRRPPQGIALPDWASQMLSRALGDERCEAWLCAAGPPPLSLRTRLGDDRLALAGALRRARPEASVRESTLSPLALLLDRAGDPRTLPGYAEGRFSVQEEGAQLVALCVGAKPGDVIADLCAGHGGKTALLCEAIGPQGELVAVDLDQRKLDRIPQELLRLGLNAHNVERRAIDLTVGDGGLLPRFERVLIDAPCTGLGTIRRRPELLLRLNETDPARMADLQLAILRQAVHLLRREGVLTYAVCSPTVEEGPSVAARIEAEVPALERVCTAPLPGLVLDPDGVLRIGPWLSGPGGDSPDVYQIITWKFR